jgi:hypothetical protein
LARVRGTAHENDDAGDDGEKRRKPTPLCHFLTNLNQTGAQSPSFFSS